MAKMIIIAMLIGLLVNEIEGEIRVGRSRETQGVSRRTQGVSEVYATGTTSSQAPAAGVEFLVNVIQDILADKDRRRPAQQIRAELATFLQSRNVNVNPTTLVLKVLTKLDDQDIIPFLNNDQPENTQQSETLLSGIQEALKQLPEIAVPVIQEYFMLPQLANLGLNEVSRDDVIKFLAQRIESVYATTVRGIKNLLERKGKAWIQKSQIRDALLGLSFRPDIQNPKTLIRSALMLFRTHASDREIQAQLDNEEANLAGISEDNAASMKIQRFAIPSRVYYSEVNAGSLCNAVVRLCNAAGINVSMDDCFSIVE